MKSNRPPTRRGVADFGKNEDGNVAMIFGLTFVPMIMMVGVATDYQRMASTRSALLQATDVAALSVASKINSTTTDAQAQNQAQVILNAQTRMANATIVTSSISADRLTFCATTQISVNMTFMKIAGFRTMTPSATSCANLAGGIDPNTTYEIALVLDNSGSMGESTSGTTKISALKSAANSFVNTMFTKAPGKVQFSVAPFASGVVAVDPTLASSRTASWIDLAGASSQHWITFGGKTAANAAGFTNRFDVFTKLKTVSSSWDWGGCFEDQPYPLNVKDTPPTSAQADTLFVPFLAPDEPNANSYNNNYLVDPSNNNNGNNGGWGGWGGRNNNSCSGSSCWTSLTNAAKYSSPSSSGNNSNSGYGDTTGPNAYCPNYSTETLLQLTSTQSTVTRKLNNLVANGNTNLHQGFMWGWRTLSPNAPFATGRAYNAASNRKIMVFMTDGFNAWNSQPGTAVGSTYQPLGYYSYNGAVNARFANGASGDGVNYQSQLAASSANNSDYSSNARTALDDLTAEACANAKAQGVEIFTIGFSIPSNPIDAAGLALLKSCATNADHYFPVSDASQLNLAFSGIGSGLGKLRLSQ